MKQILSKAIRYFFYLLIAGIIVWLAIVFYVLSSFFGYTEEETFTSPEGTNTIIMKYDFFSRPDIFKEGLLWDKKIWEYPGPAFMETVHFGVEWLSENQILVDYDDADDKYDEEFIITIPD